MTVAVRASTLIDGTGADPVRGRFVVIDEALELADRFAATGKLA